MELSTLLIQLIVIITLAHGLGWATRKIHQPYVVGEMIAGIVLGPSVCGWALPTLSQILFRPEQLGPLRALSQIGLIIFMFLVGLEFNPRQIREHAQTIVFTSCASLVVPFISGAALALLLYSRLAGQVPLAHFVLFFATAMSITAFPVLARILAERRQSQTKLGVIALSCAALGDVSAWMLLAAVLLFIRTSGKSVDISLVLAGVVAYIAAMSLGAHRLLRRLNTTYQERGGITPGILATAIIVMLGSSWITEYLGIHALFGAFMAGLVMPKHPAFTRALAEKCAGALTLLLPIYFAFTGLASSIGLIQGAEAWLICGAIAMIAVASKFGAAAMAARLAGQPWHIAGALGTLMNARGLMELIILNIGLEHGIISPALFTMMVLMAVVTTLITTPLLSLFTPPNADETRSDVQPSGKLAPQ